MVRSTRILAATLAMTFLPPVFCSSAAAQSKKNQEFIPGTVVSIEKAKTGRNYVMKFKSTADDEEFDVVIQPRTQLAVTGKGDEGFLKPNVFVQTRVVLTNKELYAKDFIVILGVTPPAFVKPDPADKTVFDISGKVTMTDTTGMMVQCGPQPRKISFEAQKNVTVKISDPSLIKEGDTAEVEGTIIKSKKTMNAVAVNVTSATEFNSDEYFAALEEKSKSKTSRSKSSAKSKKDAASEEFDATNPFKNVDKKKPTKDSVKFDETNPFKDVDKKKGTKSKDEKSSDAESKKEEAKKDPESKDTEKKDEAGKDKGASKKDGEKSDKP